MGITINLFFFNSYYRPPVQQVIVFVQLRVEPLGKAFQPEKHGLTPWKFVPKDWPWQSCGHVIKISIQSIVHACCGNIQGLLALIFVKLTWRGLDKTRLVSETRVGFLISEGQEKGMSIMWNKYLWDCCCCWRPIEPAELTGTRAALNIRSYQNFPYRILRQWWWLHFPDIPLLWIRLHRTSNCGRWGSSGSAWRAAKFYQIGKGEEEVIHAGNEDSNLN